jgi:hypothetical protein
LDHIQHGHLSGTGFGHIHNHAMQVILLKIGV